MDNLDVYSKEVSEKLFHELHRDLGMGRAMTFIGIDSPEKLLGDLQPRGSTQEVKFKMLQKTIEDCYDEDLSIEEAVIFYKPKLKILYKDQGEVRDVF